MAAVLVALFRTGKARECITFTAYLAVALGFTCFVLAFPLKYSPQVFLVKQGIYDALLLGMSIELSIRVFAKFTGVANRVRVLLSLLVIASTAVIVLATPPHPIYSDLARYQPAITTGGIWCLSFVAFLIVWYQIPVPAFTKAILLGYVPYLVVFVIFIDLIGRLGWGSIQGLNVMNAIAYDVLAGYWAYVAWHKDEALT